MGNYQRDWVEQSEIAVAEAINDINISKIHIQKIAESIIKKIGEIHSSLIMEAIWTGGGSYHNPGDIEIILADNTNIPIELKFSFEDSSGTKANTSTTALKKFISSDIKPYPLYDKELGLLQKRFELVEERIGRRLKNKADYGRCLRSIKNDEEDLGLLREIAEITSPGQEEYASYAAAEMNKNLKNVNQWVQRILSGNNTTQRVVVNKNFLYCVIKKYQKKNQTVEFYDFTDMDSNITQVISRGKSIKLQNSSSKDVLRASVNWKNICQGGQNPSLNVFIGNAYCK